MSAVAIFVKTPGISAVKTRLAATLGAGNAAALYRRCAAAVADAAREADLGAVYWATAEPLPEVGQQWSDLPRLEQGNGGLGERMHRILNELVERHGGGLLLGADAPQLEPRELERAARHLERDVPARVIGPARDGGFWIFGANHVPEPGGWTRVVYSRPDTLVSFRNSIGNDAEWLELPMLSDLDTNEDVQRIAAELRDLRHPLPSQLALVAALEEFEPET